MVRTLISLPEKDKAWLDKTAKSQHVAASALVRKAVAEFRAREESEPGSFEKLHESVQGLWKKGDSVAFVRKLRKEWDR
jgi:hypothetical protein